MEETFIPLNDFRQIKRTNSKGSNSDIELEPEGMEDTLEFRIQAVDATGGRKISLWHDINLIHIDPDTRQETPYFNFVCEIPKFSR